MLQKVANFASNWEEANRMRICDMRIFDMRICDMRICDMRISWEKACALPYHYLITCRARSTQTRCRVRHCTRNGCPCFF